MFGPEKGATHVLAPKKGTNWGTTTDALGFTVSPLTMIISFPREKAGSIKKLMLDRRPSSRRQAKVRDGGRSMARKSLNLTYEVARAGKVFRVEAVAADRIARLTKSPKAEPYGGTW